MSSNLPLHILIIMCVVFVVFSAAIIALAIRVDYLTKKVNQLDTDIFEANIKIDHKYMNALDKIQKNQYLIENTIDHNSSVTKSLNDILSQNTESIAQSKVLIGQCKEVLHKNIDICKLNEELQESCQKLLKMNEELQESCQKLLKMKASTAGFDISCDVEDEGIVI